MLVTALFLFVAVVPGDTNTPAASESVNVRFGSLADICSAESHVRFTPESGQ